MRTVTTILKYVKGHSIIRQPPNPTLFQALLRVGLERFHCSPFPPLPPLSPLYPPTVLPPYTTHASTLYFHHIPHMLYFFWVEIFADHRCLHSALFFLLSDMLFHCTRAQSKFSQTLTFKFSFQSARTVNIKPRKRLKHLTLVIIVHPYCFESRYVRSVSIILPCQL